MMKLAKVRLSLFLFATILFALIPSVQVQAVDVDELHNEANVYNLAEEIAALPEVSDPMGTEYYFYNQLSDVGKAFYWAISKATWDKPWVVFTGVGTYTQDALLEQFNNAKAALFADHPEYNMRWTGNFSWDCGTESITIHLQQLPGSSTYLYEKAMGKLQEFVETIGPEGDLYSRVGDMMQLLHREVDYDLTGKTEVTGSVRASGYGCLIYRFAICDGYADAVKMLCDTLEIPCIIVGNAAHAWNYVRMEDGKWYAVDGTVDAPFDWDCHLMGTTTGSYTQNPNYSVSDLYLSREGDFSFPALAETAYVYDGTYEESFHEPEHVYVEPDPLFVYAVNDDGATCTITDYEGLQAGDLIIPNTLDGYPVTAIGDHAFFGCFEFTGDLVIPDTVTSIGIGAFSKCSGFQGSLILSENITSIGDEAFYGCKNLSGGLALPDSLLSLGKEPFVGCVGFEGTLYLPDTVEYIPGMWTEVEFDSIRVNETNERYAVYDGVLYSKDMKTLLLCPGGKDGVLRIPESVEVIADYACYWCHDLSGTLVLPDGLQSIGTMAFQDCGFTGDLVLPNSLRQIKKWAFSGCKFDGTIALSEGLEEICDGVFWGCPFTGSLIVPNMIKRIGSNAFFAANFDGEIHISDAIEHIGEYAISGVFTNALELKDSDVVLSKDAFFSAHFAHYSCNCGLQYEVQVTPDYTTYRCPNCGGNYNETQKPDELQYSADGKTLLYCPREKMGALVIPEGVEVIADNACAGCTGLTGELKLPDGLKEIGSQAFADCSFEGNLMIPNSVTQIAEYAFSGTKFAGSVVLPNNLEVIKEGTFWGCGFTESIFIPASVTQIKDMAFFTGGYGTVSYVIKYEGTAEQWAQIQIGSFNDGITNATVLFESSPSLPESGGSSCEQNGHTEEIIPAVAATCTATGLTAGKKCSICGEILMEQDVTPALGHKFQDGFCETCGEEEPDQGNHTPGDINDDGKVNNKDLTRLFQYLSNWEVEVVEEALDINGDDKVNNKDLTRLFQYLSNWDVEIF